MIKSVDSGKGSSFTITLKDKKERTFLVDKSTEFYGPKGGDRGTGAAGLKDDCMAAGFEVRVNLVADGKTAKTSSPAQSQDGFQGKGQKKDKK